MDNNNAAKVQPRLSKKRNGEKGRTDDPNVNNNHKTNGTSQENVQKKQRKRKYTVQKTEDLLTSNDATTEDNPKEKTSKKPSKRQIKKEKAVQVAAQKRHSSRLSAMQKALSYVSMWKHSRNEWKFEKLKQILLMDNLLDENSIPETIFPIVLEYFEGCKGMARETLLRKGMEVIRKAEEKEEEKEEESKNEIMKSVAYKRARQLLQTLPADK